MSGRSSSADDDSKAAAASRVLARVGAASTALAELLRQARRVCGAYVQLADLDLGNTQKEMGVDLLAFRNKFALAQLREEDVGRVAVLTCPPPVSEDGVYTSDNVVFIQRFHATFQLVGGVNVPRVIYCYGTDGRRYKQLVKGNDDSRQDAVMQQVFDHVNQWLARSAAGRARRLRMCTYHVVPLSQRVGVLEWCQNTCPLGQWLLRGSDSAHARYSPRGSWQHEVCRAKMKDAGKTSRLPAGQTREELLLLSYRQVCAHFPSVMRRFFSENYADAGTWFERRLCYTRSAAVASMVGYIIGLGDRHPSNILLRTDTAELVHIDLGVAFEQGKLLPTPERVPFRLTRDMVDGMGAANTEGPFRRTCERTLQVLQEAQLPLLTILEVFLHDPLHVWRLSPVKAAQLQEMEEALHPTMMGAESTALGGWAGTASVIGGGFGIGLASAYGGPFVPLTPHGAGMPSVAAPSRTGAAGPAWSGADDAAGMTNEEGEARRVLARLRAKLQGFYDGTQLGTQGQVNSLIQVR